MEEDFDIEPLLVEAEDLATRRELRRKGLTALQRAEAYKGLYEKLKGEVGGVKDKHIVSTIAMMEEELTGEKPSEKTVYDYLRLVELPRNVKMKIRETKKRELRGITGDISTILLRWLL